MQLPTKLDGCRRALLFVLALTPAGGALASGPATRAIRYQGIELSLDIAAAHRGVPRAGELFDVRLTVRDTATSTPLPALAPAAWLERVEAGADVDPATCQSRGESFLGGSLLSPPTVDLNVYSVLTLNDDATLSVLEPHFGFGGSRLSALISLPGRAADWALSQEGERLFVSMPAAGRLAVVDTARWRLVRTFDLGGHPRRLALQPDGRYLWVAREGDRPDQPSGVTVVDVEELEVVGQVATGAGAHDLAFSGDGRTVFVTNREAGTVSVLDVSKRTKLGDLRAGGEPTSVAWSEAAQAAYVVDTGGTVVAVDRGFRSRARIEAEPGLGEIRFAPGGRLGFVVDPRRDLVHILDAARNRIVQTAEVEAGPDRVSFSDELAYVRHRGSEIVLMIPLDAVGRQGVPVPVLDFPGGQNPLGLGEPPVLSDSIVQVPGAGAVLVANPVDRAVYYYKEGMAAPMGGFPTGIRQPRAVLALDRSLQERSPGTYATRLSVERPGRYQLVLYLDSPRLVRCFELEVTPGSELPEGSADTPSLRVESLVQPSALAPGRAVELRFRLTDPGSGRALPALADVSVLTFRAPGRGRRRLPLAVVGDGVYATRWTPDEAGVHYVFVECPSRGLRAGNRPVLTVAVREEPPGS